MGSDPRKQKTEKKPCFLKFCAPSKQSTLLSSPSSSETLAWVEILVLPPHYHVRLTINNNLSSSSRMVRKRPTLHRTNPRFTAGSSPSPCQTHRNTCVSHTRIHPIHAHDPDAECLFSSILGHEGSSIVKSVGEDVTNVTTGNHVLLLYMPECGDCMHCKSPNTSLCGRIRATQIAGKMPDGTTRFSSKGKQLYHYMGTSTFSEYTVVADISVVKLRDDAPLEKVCLFALRYYNGSWNCPKYLQGREGLICRSFSVSVVQGAKSSGAFVIYAVDTNPDKWDMARLFGATHFVNPRDYKDPILQVLIKMTHGGFDYTFECGGRVDKMLAALEACRIGWGESCVIGAAGARQESCKQPFQLLTGRVWRGCAFGGVKSRSQLPYLIDEYMNGELKVDEMVSATYSLDNINDALSDTLNGKNIRGVVHYDTSSEVKPRQDEAGRGSTSGDDVAGMLAIQLQSN